MGPSLREIIISKLKELQGRLVTNIKIKERKVIPLSRTTTKDIENLAPVKVIHKIYRPGDIIIGDTEKRFFVISNDIICEIVNRENERRNVSIRLIKIKCNSGCSYVLAEGEIL